MPIRHLTIEVPRVLKRHDLGVNIGKTLDAGIFGPWRIKDEMLFPTRIPETILRVKHDLRDWSASGLQLLRVHVVIQTGRPVQGKPTQRKTLEYLTPLLFIAAADRHGYFDRVLLGDVSRLPPKVLETFTRAVEAFPIRESWFSKDFTFAARIVYEAVSATGWFNPENQRLWHDSKLL